MSARWSKVRERQPVSKQTFEVSGLRIALRARNSSISRRDLVTPAGMTGVVGRKSGLSLKPRGGHHAVWHHKRLSS